MARLVPDLDACFIRREVRVETKRFIKAEAIAARPHGPYTDDDTYERTGPVEYIPIVDTIAEADGLMFLCPKCCAANGGAVGTHRVICWFVGRVPDDVDPKPGRWTPRGTSLSDLTFVPSAGRSHSVLLTGEPRASRDRFIRAHTSAPSAESLGDVAIKVASPLPARFLAKERAIRGGHTRCIEAREPPPLELLAESPLACVRSIVRGVVAHAVMEHEFALDQLVERCGGAIEDVLRVVDPDLAWRDVAVASLVATHREVDVEHVSDLLSVHEVDREPADAAEEAQAR